MAPDEITLPLLRADLRLVTLAPEADEDERWAIYDPLRHTYHRINLQTLEIVRHWTPGPITQSTDHINKSSGIQVSVDRLAELLSFFEAHGLVDHQGSALTSALAKQRAKKKSESLRRLIHAYVFLRIPLFRPQRFLDALKPCTRIFYTPAFWIALFCLIGLEAYLVSRDWDRFISTFFGFLSWEGAAGYGLALVIVKIAHEFGHALTATRYGCRVPVMGIGFLLMFPILFTDTTDAWQLTDKRKRLAIASAGVAAEIILAVFATLMWFLLAEGALKSILFFIATTSWILTLFINLNPFMRFDGYYLLSDLLGIDNLQPRANAMGRWALRESLFRPGESRPESVAPNTARLMVIYAYILWVYRFFLFVGIALLLHGFFIKAIAIFLAALEIGWFIVLPILSEIRKWPALISRGNRVRRAASGLAFLACVMTLVLPWRSAILVPAVHRPVETTAVYAPFPARLEKLMVGAGEHVGAGDPVAVFSSPYLDLQIRANDTERQLLASRLGRLASDQTDRAQRLIIERQLYKAQKRREGLKKLQADLVVRAPIDGITYSLPRGLRPGDWIGRDTPLLRLHEPARGEIVAFIAEDDISNLRSGGKARFYPDDPVGKPVSASLADIAPIGLARINTPLIASTFGGPLPATTGADGSPEPARGTFEAVLIADGQISREVRGWVRLETTRYSVVSGLARRATALWNREIGR